MFPNLHFSKMEFDVLLQCIASDMRVFYMKGMHYVLTLYISIWNNGIATNAFCPSVASE